MRLFQKLSIIAYISHVRMMEWRWLIEDIEDNFIPYIFPPPLDFPLSLSLYIPNLPKCIVL